MDMMFHNTQNHLPGETFTYEDCHFILQKYREEKGHDPIFISSWDADEKVRLPYFILEKTLPYLSPDINKYYLIGEDQGQTSVAHYLNNRIGIELSPSQIIIGGSATSLICFTLLVLTNRRKHILVLEPSYYSVHDTLDLLHCQYHSVCVSIPGFTYDYKEIEAIIQHEKINVIVVTDPIFGSGIPLSQECYHRLTDLANQYHCTLVVDLARMGLSWDAKDEPILGEQFAWIQRAKEYVAVYSPCKKVFANGMKTGILLSSEGLVNKMQCYGDSVLGSISASQSLFLSTLLLDDSRDYISRQICENISLAKSRFEIINTLFHQQKCTIYKPQMGHYALVTLPIAGSTEWQTFLKLLHQADVYTLPMGLYGYNSNLLYSFRVNLFTDIKKLIEAADRIVTTLENSE